MHTEDRTTATRRAARLRTSLFLTALAAAGAATGCERDVATPGPAGGGGKSGAGGNGGAGGEVPKVPDLPAGRTGGFVEAGRELGVTFRMQFLRGEQGENFKINLYDHGAGVSVADIDGDGDDDIYFCNQLGSNALYRNDGGRFTDVTKEAGVGLAERISVTSVFGDYDSDGDQDLYVTTTRGGNALFRNDGKGNFEDVTAKAGLTQVSHAEQPVLFDADADGDADLFVSGTALWTRDVLEPGRRYYEGRANLAELVASPTELNHYYRNEGNGTFTDVTEEAGLQGVGWGGDCGVFDFDEDGDLDLFLANMFGRSLLFRNDGKAKFTSCAEEVLGRTSWGAVGAKVFDYDLDGRLDLFIVDMHSDMWISTNFAYDKVEPSRKYKGAEGPMFEMGLFSAEETKKFNDLLGVKAETVVFGNTLYRALGGGRFEEVSDRAKAETFQPWSAGVGDFDGNGGEDVFIAAGMGWPWQYWPPAFLVNQLDGTFAEKAKEAGLDPPPDGTLLDVQFPAGRAAKSSRAAAVSDFDGDGRLDLIVNNFNDRAHLYLNRYPKKPWAGFRLKATHGHADAVGAVVVVKAGGKTLVRQVHTAGGYLSQSSRTLHFALGDAAAIESCEVRWPGRKTQFVKDVKLGAVNDVTEE